MDDPVEALNRQLEDHISACTARWLVLAAGIIAAFGLIVVLFANISR